MKPAPFEYDDPRTLSETLSLLAQHGEDAKILAGGQSLVPLLNFRLARPARLIDINNVSEIDYLRFENGVLRIGALTRHSGLERSTEVSARLPLLAECVRHIGHVQIRNRGTVGGSVAHADAAAELPAVFAALDARFHARSEHGGRVLDSERFFVSHMTTALEADEVLTEIEVPLPSARTTAGFCEFTRRHGDFAIGGAAVLVTAAPDGTCDRAAIALLAVAPTPVRARQAEAFLVGRRIDDRVCAEAARLAISDAHPTGDIHGDAEYRLELAEVMVRRALRQATNGT